MRSAVSLACIGLLIGSGWATAAEAPILVGPFVASCKTDFKACQDQIISSFFAAVTTDMINKTAVSCATPGNIPTVERDRALVAWLQARPQMANQTLDAGLQTASKALWNCRIKLPNGLTS